MFANENEIEWSEIGPENTGFRRKQLGRAAGGENVGCSLYELPAGERAWPYHYHTRNEEALYVLEGTGSLRLPDENRPLAVGTYVALPTGKGSAHRVVNDSEGVLRYLVVSTMDHPDVLGYPDAGVVGVYAGSAPGGRKDERVLSGFFEESDAVEFWTEVGDADSDE